MFSVHSFTFSPIEENTYLLYNEKAQCIIIDPGCYFLEEKEVLKEFVRMKGLIPVLLLNTHCHLDHVFGNKLAADTWNLPLHIHPDERKMLDLAPASGLIYNLPFDNYTGEFIYLEDGKKINLDGDELEIILAPGHAPGHCCFYSAQQGFIISGDVLFYRSIGRTDLPYGNHEQLLKSIRERIFVLPDNTIVYPGHGSATQVGDEKKFNPFLNGL